jgi:hypothetical protein
MELRAINELPVPANCNICVQSQREKYSVRASIIRFLETKLRLTVNHE